jgi:hypothetical protein
MESGSEGDDNSSVIEERSLSGDEDDSDEDSSESSDEEEEDFTFDGILQRVRQNDPAINIICWCGIYERIQNMTDEEWEELGRDISNNTHLEELALYEGALNDTKMSFLFRGLTSSTFKDMELYRNELSVEGVRSMVPFLQNANNLTKLYLGGNNIQSEGFNMLFRALRDSPIKQLQCNKNGIESIDIDSDHIPRNLETLYLQGNCIDADGCRGLATLLQGGNPTLTTLRLDDNKIDDEGVAILVDALHNNTSLKIFDLSGNDDISNEGGIMLLKLVNDISSIKATLETNLTLNYLRIGKHEEEEFQQNINYAVGFNCNMRKVIQTQLHNIRRADLCRLQRIERSDAALYSEFNPLCLPEVLALVGRTHGLAELHVALKSSIAGVISMVNRKECIQQQRAYHAAKLEELDAELATIEESESQVVEVGESRSNKRRRKWWWGLWGGA